jgi:hypothetical protein
MHEIHILLSPLTEVPDKAVVMVTARPFIGTVIVKLYKYKKTIRILNYHLLIIKLTCNIIKKLEGEIFIVNAHYYTWASLVDLLWEFSSSQLYNKLELCTL